MKLQCIKRFRSTSRHFYGGFCRDSLTHGECGKREMGQTETKVIYSALDLYSKAYVYVVQLKVTETRKRGRRRKAKDDC